MTGALWLSVRFLALSALLLGAFILTPLQRAASGLVAWTATGILRACSGAPISWLPSDGDIEFTVDDDPTNDTETVPLDPVVHVLNITEHTRNLPLFLAIVFAAAGGRRSRLAFVLPVGLLVLVLLDGLIVAADGWTDLQPTVPYNAAYEVLAVLSVFHLTGAGMFAAPVFVGALIALTLQRDVPIPARERPGRNDECFCGSGLKFKRCCGS